MGIQNQLGECWGGNQIGYYSFDTTECTKEDGIYIGEEYKNSVYYVG